MTRAAEPKNPPKNPWIQTASGKAFDLLEPTVDMVDFDTDIAEALARIPRFGGHVRSGPYSVAQHCVMGADHLMQETRHIGLAAAFLLHDAHEAYLGDWTTPVAWAIQAYARIEFGLIPLKAGIDAVIFEAAGVKYSPTIMNSIIRETDLRMLATERRWLLGPSPHPWATAVEAAAPIRMTGKLTVWPWPRAADEYRERLRRYIPDFDRRNRAA